MKGLRATFNQRRPPDPKITGWVKVKPWSATNGGGCSYQAIRIRCQMTVIKDENF
jgi:hypothetical protein